MTIDLELVTRKGLKFMQRQLLLSKIHRATITQCEIDYEGSIAIDEDLMDAAGIVSWEKVLVANFENGSRLETYAIPGPRGSGVICLNGAAAKWGKVGDLIIIIAFGLFQESEVENHRPKTILVDSENKIVRELQHH